MLGVPVQYLAWLFSPLPRRAQAAIARTVGRVASTARGHAVLPPPSPSVCPKIPLPGTHLPDAIRQGTVRLRPGVAGFGDDNVRFADGSTGVFDHLILATGYRAAPGALGQQIQLDPCGFARRRGRVTSADRPGLYFVGQTYSMIGAIYNIGRDAGLLAREVAAFLRSGA